MTTQMTFKLNIVYVEKVLNLQITRTTEQHKSDRLYMGLYGEHDE